MEKKEQIQKLITAFVDSEENEFYVSLERSRLNYSKMVNALHNPFKIILLFGPPGSGKSFLFHKFFKEYASEYPLFLYKTPDFNQSALKSIYESVTKQTIRSSDNMEALERLREIEKEIIVMLDEAQLYSQEQMEWIRLLSNEKNLKFIISVHKVANEDLLAQKHFRTRIYETIRFEPLKPEEITQYIEEKLLLSDAQNIFSKFDKKSCKLIYSFSEGNLRDINRLLNRFFSLIHSAVEANSSFVLSSKLVNKFIEMAAIDLGMVKSKSWIRQWI